MFSTSPFTLWISSSPELSHFFQSNHPPSASLSMVLSWSDLLAKAEAVVAEELSHLDGVISYPGSRVQSRKAYLHFLLINKSILSPIHRLPPEILLRIFQEVRVTIGTNADTYYDVADASSGPWMLSQVCGRWRTLVIFSATLWSRPFIILNRSATSNAIVPPLELALARSSQADLCFFLSQSFRQLGVQAELFKEVLNLLVPHSSRWAEVVFEKKEWDDIDISTLNAVRGNVPLLSKVTFEYVGYFLRPPPLPQAIRAFSDAPLLKRVALLGYVLTHDIDIVLPWNQIVQFEYTINNRFSTLLSRTEACLDVLDRTPMLSAFSMVNQGHSRSCLAPLECPPRTSVHTSLISLRTNDVGLIDTLVLPSLECLTVSLNCQKWAAVSLNAAKVIHHLSIRSCCTLKCLRLIGIEMCREHIVDGLLTSSQSLSVFEYRNGCSRGDDIPYLLDQLTEGSLLPNLTEISLEYSQALTSRTRFAVLVEKILRFAENRRGIVRHVDNSVLVKEWKTLPVFNKFCRDARDCIGDLAVKGVTVVINVIADIDGVDHIREREALTS